MDGIGQTMSCGAHSAFQILLLNSPVQYSECDKRLTRNKQNIMSRLKKEKQFSNFKQHSIKTPFIWLR